MEDYFKVKFQANGIHYNASIFPGDNGIHTYFQIYFKIVGVEDEPELIFIEMGDIDVDNPNPYWIQKRGVLDQITVSEEFITALGEAIESHD